jgi:hypothetical protein
MSYTDPATILPNPAQGNLVPHQLLDVYNTDLEYFNTQITAILASIATITGNLPADYTHLGANAPSARAFAGTTQAITSGTPAQITTSSTSYLNNGFILSGNSLKIPLAGLYLVFGECQTTTTAAAQSVQAQIRGGAAGTTILSEGTQPISSGTSQTVTSNVADLISCNLNDLVGLWGAVNANMSTSIPGTPSQANYFYLIYQGTT